MADSQNSGAITCQELAGQATEYIENRLAPDARNLIEQHLLSCAACRTYVEQLNLVRASLRNLPEPPTSDSKLETLSEHFQRTMRDPKRPS